MAEWEANPNLDYSATGDDIDSASVKIINMFNDVYKKLNRLRNMDASTDHSVGDAVPFSFKIDTSVNPPALLIRNETNTGYVQIGSVAENMGMTAESFGGVQGENMGKLILGTENNLPAVADTYDMYFAYDTRRLYIYLTGAWRVFLSLQFEDLLNVSDNIVVKAEVAENGAEKIPRLNSVGQGEFDITGSAHKLGGIKLYLPEVHDGQVLVYNEARDRWEVASRADIKLSDISTTGEPNKIVKTDSEGVAHVNIAGSAAKIAGKAIDVNDLQDNETLIYDATHGTFVNKEVPTVDASGVMEGVNITGSAEKWGGLDSAFNDIQDGQVPVWSSFRNAFVNADQGGVGAARELTLMRGETTLGVYNGSESVTIDVGNDSEPIAVGPGQPENAVIWFKTIDNEGGGE